MTSPTNHTLASLAQKMGGGSGLLTAWCGMTDPIMAGVLAREFDTVTLDMQHGCYDIASITNAVAHVSAAGKPAIVRIPVGQFAIASRVLDLGACCHRADDQFGRGCEGVCIIHEISADWRTQLGPGHSAHHDQHADGRLSEAGQ